MLDTHRLPIFLAASTVLILTPGPAVLYIVTRSVSQGRAAGIFSALGVGIGNFTHALCAAFGLSAILASSAIAYSCLRYVGAAYLVFLGVQKLLSKTLADATAPAPTRSRQAVFKKGIVVGILNPKTALFFLAFLPQFADPARGSLRAQLLFLGSTFVVMAVISDSLYALLSGVLAQWLKQRAFFKHQKYVAGSVYCGLGLAAALSTPARHS